MKPLQILAARRHYTRFEWPPKGSIQGARQVRIVGWDQILNFRIAKSAPGDITRALVMASCAPAHPHPPGPVIPTRRDIRRSCVPFLSPFDRVKDLKNFSDPADAWLVVGREGTTRTKKKVISSVELKAASRYRIREL
jgi:hypothetical protein